MIVHVPVPFMPTTSTIFSASGSPLPLSLKLITLLVTSIRKLWSSDWFHALKTSSISALLMPATFFIRS
jgi:hypothetical protein